MFALLPLIASIVPGLVGSLFGSNAGEIAKSVGVAAQQVFGTDDKAAIEQAIAKDPSLALAFKSKLLDIQDNESRRLHEERMAEIGDKSNARQAFAGNRQVFWLGVATLVTFAASVFGVMYGCYEIMTEGIKIKDPGVIAVVFSTLGSLVGLLASDAKQVNQFFFGSSRGSEQKTDVFAAQMQELAKGLANSKPSK